MSDTITIRGNVVADPERRPIGPGAAVTTFRVASSQRHRDRSTGQWVESGTNWYAVSAFRALGEHAFASLHKGERVIVTGRLRLREWETSVRKGISVEIDADGIGHDLLWGTTQYRRAGASAAPPQTTEPTDSWATVPLGEGSAEPAPRPRDWGAPVQDSPIRADADDRLVASVSRGSGPDDTPF